MEKEMVGLKNKNENVAFSIDQLSIKQLVGLSIDSNEQQHLELESRKELIKRGKDNIQERIQIKKTCKNSISDLEMLLEKNTNSRNGNNTNNGNKETTKLLKSKFLHSVSVFDKLELEWQKYDLGIKK